MTTTRRSLRVPVLTGSLGMTALAFIATQIVSSALIPPLAVFALVHLVAAVAIWRWHGKRWLPAAVAALAGIILLASVPFLIEDFGHPESFFSFFIALATVVAAAISVITGALWRTGPSEVATRRVAASGVAIVAIGLVSSLLAMAGLENDRQATGDIVVLSKDVKFVPGTLELSPGRTSVFIKNEDLIRHTFVIEETGVKQELPGNTDRRMEFDLPAGTYRFYCDVPGHENMEGTIKVS